MNRKISIEQYLCSASVSLADVAAMLLIEERARLPLPADGIPAHIAVAEVSPACVFADERATVRPSAA